MARAARDHLLRAHQAILRDMNPDGDPCCSLALQGVEAAMHWLEEAENGRITIERIEEQENEPA